MAATSIYHTHASRDNISIMAIDTFHFCSLYFDHFLSWRSRILSPKQNATGVEKKDRRCDILHQKKESREHESGQPKRGE